MSVPESIAYERRRAVRRGPRHEVLRFHDRDQRDDVARRIRDLLASVLRRQTGPEQPLAPEDELVRDLGSSRAAVRDALGLLRAEGRIRRVQGVGSLPVSTVVTGRCDLLHDLLYDDESMLLRNEVLHAAVLDATPRELAERLQIPEGGEVLALERRSLLNEEPVAIRTFYLPAHRVPGFLDGDLTGDFYGMLDARGLAVGSAELVIQVALADDSTARLFGCEPGTPVYVLENLTCTPEGDPLFVSFGRLRCDRAALLVSKKAGVPA